MTASWCSARAEIVAALQSRDLHGRAGWVERSPPRLVDVRTNSSLLQMLGIDPAVMSPVAGSLGDGALHA